MDISNEGTPPEMLNSEDVDWDAILLNIKRMRGTNTTPGEYRELLVQVLSSLQEELKNNGELRKKLAAEEARRG